MSFPLLDVTLPAPSVWDILAGCLDNLPPIFSTAGASHAGDDAFSGWPASPAPFSIIHLPDEESDTHFPLYPKSQLFSPNASLVSMILAGCYCSFCFANILFLLIVEEYYF